MKSKTQTLEELKAIEAARGFKRGWAEHVFKARQIKLTQPTNTMQYQQIKKLAISSYPPTQELLRNVSKDIGTATEIQQALCMTRSGKRTIRRWISGELQIPLIYWVMMCWERELKLEAK